MVFGRNIIAQEYFFHKIKNNYMVSFPPYSVTKSFDAGVETIGPIRLLSDGSLVFTGKKQGQRKLKQYNPYTGAEINCVDIPEAHDLFPVELHGTSSLAISLM